MQSTLLEFLNMGGGEIALIMVAILLLFGGKKLPELARGLGKGIREFKDASEGVKREIHRNINAVDTDEPETTVEENRQAHHPIVDAPIQSTIAENVEPQHAEAHNGQDVNEPIAEEDLVDIKAKETHS